MMRLRKQTKSKRPKVEKPDGISIAWMKTKAFSAQSVTMTSDGIVWLWNRLVELYCDTMAVIAKMPVPLIVFLVSLLVYSYRPIVQGLDDNTPLRFGAMQIATDGAPSWEVLSPDITASQGFSRNAAGIIAAHTPMGSAALGAVVFRGAISLGFDMSPENIVFFDCFAATLITALTMGMFAWVVRRHGRKTALVMGLMFAFGTACWGVSSRQLWQHTGELFWLIAALCVLDGASRRGVRLIIATFFFALAFWCRPQVFPIVLIILGYQWRRNRRLGLVSLGILGVLMLWWMSNNFFTTGNIFGTYLYAAVKDAISKMTPGNVFDSMIGAYFAPNVGMVIFSPLVLLGICLLPGAWRRRHKDHDLAVMALAAAVGVVGRGLVSNWAGWNVFGGRYMLDFMPCMLIVMAPFVHSLIEGNNPRWSRKKLWLIRTVFVLAVGISVTVQWLGTTRESFQWSLKMEKYYDFWYKKRAWEWRRPLLMHVLTYGKHTAGWPEKPENYLLPRDGVIKFNPGPNKYIWYGMGQGDPYGWWTVPPQSGIAITLSKKAWYKMQVTVAGPSYILDPTKVEFFWNGQKIGEHLFEGGYLAPEQTQWMDLPRDDADLNVGKISALEIRTSRSYYGWLASQGATGVAIVNLNIQEF